MRRKTYLARNFGHNILDNPTRLEGLSMVIWVILFWPFYAFIGFIILAGCGVLGDGHYEQNNSESYPVQYQDQQEAIQWERETGKEEIAKWKSDQYQLDHNPDHQIH